MANIKKNNAAIDKFLGISSKKSYDTDIVEILGVLHAIDLKGFYFRIQSLDKGRTHSVRIGKIGYEPFIKTARRSMLEACYDAVVWFVEYYNEHTPE